MKKRQAGIISVLAIVFLMGAACSRSQVLSTLSAVVVAAEVAVPVIGAATGVPPETIAVIVRYLEAVGKATAAASDILAGTGSAAEKSAQIAQAFATVSKGCNCVKPGTPTQIVNVVEAVAQAVIRFLANFQGGPQARTAQPDLVSPGETKQLVALRKRSESIIGAMERKKEK